MTGVSAGEVTVTVTTADGNRTANLTLTVRPNVIKVTDVTVTNAAGLFTGNMEVGGSLSLTASVAPSNATDKTLTWSVADQTGADAASMLSTDGGVFFTPTAAGSYTVKASTNDGSGVYGEYTVKVFAAKTVFTGENAELKGGLYYNSGEHCIGSISSGDTAKFTVLSETAQTVTLVLSIAVTSAADASFAKQFTLQVNDSAKQPDSDVVVCGTEYGWANEGLCAISEVELIAGKNTILFTAASNVNTNINSLTVFGASSVTEPVPDTPITEGTAYYFEGEDAEMTNGKLGAINVNRSDANARNNTSLGNINANEGATLTYKINAATTCKAGLYLNLAFGGSPMSGIFALSVNGTDVTVPNTYTATGATNWATYEEYWLANVDLIAGQQNVIVLTVTGSCGNFDYMKLVADAELTVPNTVSEINLSTQYELLKTGEQVSIASKVLPSAANQSLTWTSGNTSVATVNESGVVTAVGEGSALITATAKDGSNMSSSIRIFVSDQTGVRYQAEDAVLTNCQKEPNGTFVGGINNAGAKVTFTVNSDREKTVLFRISTSVVREGEITIDCFYTATLNGNPIDLSLGTFASRGDIGWNTESGFYTVEITLAQGDNVIELCSVGTGVATTLDWIEII